jgi:serine phosphatase RsbU (regulator of sigma subunit)
VGAFARDGLPAITAGLAVAERFARCAAGGVSLAATVRELNRCVAAWLPDDRACAAVACELDRACVRLHVWNGAMPPLLLARADGRVETVASARPALGVLGDDAFADEPAELAVAEGDRVIACSDGAVRAGDDDVVVVELVLDRSRVWSHS